MNVAAIIMDDGGHVLLGVPGRGTHLHFPQGGVKNGESADDALLREVREEVGLSGCRILAVYPGLRYAYRRKNKKSKLWLGQQQSYYLMHCPGVKPAVDCTGSAEFAGAVWLPSSEIRPDAFVSFKREVVMRALAHYFPEGKAYTPTDALAQLTPRLYLHHPGKAPAPLTSTPLFAGKREEALYQLAQTAPLHPGKKQRLLVIITGMEGVGFKKCLRHIAHGLDPLTTRYHLYPKDYALTPHSYLPTTGLSFIVLRPGEEDAEQLRALETAAQRTDTPLLKVALHLSRAKQLRRLEGKAPSQPWSTAHLSLLRFLDTTSEPHPWHLLPAEHGWYRDYLLLSLLHTATTQRDHHVPRA